MKKNAMLKTFLVTLAILVLAVCVMAAMTEGFTNWNPYGWLGDAEEKTVTPGGDPEVPDEPKEPTEPETPVEPEKPQADQTLCLNLTSIDELVGYEFNEASDWTQIATEASADGYSAFSLLSIDTFSPAFDEEGMFEILGAVESVTVEFNGTTYEMTASDTDGTQHMFQDAERTMYFIFMTLDESMQVGDQKYGCVILGVGANAPVESFKIVSFNMPATE